jgi:hypothetical protein
MKKQFTETMLRLEIQDRVEPPIGISDYRFPSQNTHFGLLYHLYHFDTVDQRHPVYGGITYV